MNLYGDLMPSREEILELDRLREIKDAQKVEAIPRMKLVEALFIAICSVEPGFTIKYSETERKIAVCELKRLYEFLTGQHEYSVVI